MQGSVEDEVVDAVLSASRALVGVAARSLADVADDVTLPQYRALVVLCGRGPVSMSGLADELGAAPSTVTRLCDRLVRKGLATRTHPPESRREVVAVVTEQGRDLVDQVTKRRRREIARIVEHVPAQRRAPMVRALRAFAEAAGEAPDQAWTSGWEL
jgi:DNA-binding MarR family transcriptional regulator